MTRGKEWSVCCKEVLHVGELSWAVRRTTAIAMGTFLSNTISLRRLMGLLSKVTQQLSGLRKQSTYRPSVLKSIDSLFKSSTWVNETQQERKNPLPALRVSEPRHQLVNPYIQIPSYIQMAYNVAGTWALEKTLLWSSHGSKSKSDFTQTLQTVKTSKPSCVAIKMTKKSGESNMKI